MWLQLEANHRLFRPAKCTHNAQDAHRTEASKEINQCTNQIPTTSLTFVAARPAAVRLLVQSAYKH